MNFDLCEKYAKILLSVACSPAMFLSIALCYSVNRRHFKAVYLNILWPAVIHFNIHLFEILQTLVWWRWKLINIFVSFFKLQGCCFYFVCSWTANLFWLRSNLWLFKIFLFWGVAGKIWHAQIQGYVRHWMCAFWFIELSCRRAC